MPNGDYNRLREQSSPYLRQHADNPVHWWSWGAEALAEAKARNSPILLSIGYAACHWCHVMAHESFEDNETAALMNAGFVNIKVDREERPDIDHLYMTALQAMGQRGGWPLTMFLRPDAIPFWGGTYFPPEPRYGQSSFRDVLRAIRMAWDDRAELIDDNAARLQDVLDRTARPRPGDWPDASLREEVIDRLLASLDPLRGGLSGAPKFPNAPLFRFLWQQRERDDATAAVHRLLRAMIEGGIHDQIGGGFARYSTDADWLAPHFEKMLYDNAQLLELLAFAQARRPDALYAGAADALVTWLQREMTVDGAFAASLDADSEGEEGRFYVWNAAEIAQTLTPLGQEESQAWQAAFDVTPQGNWEGHTILRRVGPLDPDLARRGGALLLDRRAGRPRPGRDDKILADWNALMIIALVRAGGVFGRKVWDDLARTTWDGVERHLAGADGRLAHAACGGLVTAGGLLDDQAAGALAALALFEAEGAQGWLARAERLCRLADRWFADPDGGYVQTPADADDLPRAGEVSIRPRIAHDGAVPAGLSMLAEAQARLFHLTGDDHWRAAATATILSMTAGAAPQLAQLPGLLFAARLLEQARTVVVDGTDCEAWISRLRYLGDPCLLILRADLGQDLPVTHPAHGRKAGSGETAAWLCEAGLCSLPNHRLEDLLAALGGD